MHNFKPARPITAAPATPEEAPSVAAAGADSATSLTPLTPNGSQAAAADSALPKTFIMVPFSFLRSLLWRYIRISRPTEKWSKYIFANTINR